MLVFTNTVFSGTSKYQTKFSVCRHESITKHFKNAANTSRDFPLTLYPSLHTQIPGARSMLNKDRRWSHPQKEHMQYSKEYNSTSKVPITQNKCSFQASCGTGAGGLVAPLLCAAYFGKLAVLFGCSLPQQA